MIGQPWWARECCDLQVWGEVGWGFVLYGRQTVFARMADFSLGSSKVPSQTVSMYESALDGWMSEYLLCKAL